MVEWFDVVDEKDKVIGKATRDECHSNPKLMHRVVYILIFNSKGELLLQKRSMKKDMSPGKWTSSASGHVDSGDNYTDAAKRELKEELGIELELVWMLKFLDITSQESEIAVIFTAKSAGPFKAEPEEIDEVKFFTIEEIKGLLSMESEMLTPNCRAVLNEYFKRVGG